MDKVPPEVWVPLWNLYCFRLWATAKWAVIKLIIIFTSLHFTAVKLKKEEETSKFCVSPDKSSLPRDSRHCHQIENGRLSFSSEALFDCFALMHRYL